MSEQLAIEVQRSDIRNTRIARAEQPALGEGQIRVAIDRFALTANNVTYAVAGDMIGYWQFYPGEGDWGHVPVWGLADVVESAHPDIAPGERLYGFYPMASHTVLTVGEPAPQYLTEVSPHRVELPAAYNNYRRTAAENAVLSEMEDERCLFFPLFATSYLLYDYLVDNGLFGAGQVVLGSASSKTAFGLAALLHGDDGISARVVGLTSPGNRQFVQDLGVYDQVSAYGEEAELDAGIPTAYVDMSGDAGLTARIHEHFRDALKESCAVGATHWESFGETPELPGPKPEFFFAPAQIAKRDAEWGGGVVMARATEAVIDIARRVSRQVSIEHIDSAEAAAAAWRDLVENRVSPDRGLMVSLGDAG